MANKIVVVEVSYLDEVGLENTLYFTEQGFVTSLTQTPINTVIEGRVMNSIRLGIAVSCIIWSGAATSTIESIELANADGYFDSIMDFQWRDRPVYIHEIDAGQSLSTSTRIATGIVDQLEIVSREKVRLTAYERLQLLEKPLQIQLYDSTVDNLDLIGTAKPWIIGNVENMHPILVDSDPKLVYEVNSDEPNVIVNVREGGAVLDEGSGDDYTVDLLGFTLVGSPNSQLTVSVATSTTGGFEFLDVDLLGGIGDFNTWTAGDPDGWTFIASIVGGADGAFAESGAGGEVERTSTVGNGSNLDSGETDDAFRWIPGGTYQYSIKIVSESGNGSGVGIDNIRLAIKYTTIFFVVENMFGLGGHTLDGASGTFTGEFVVNAPIGFTGFGEVAILFQVDDGTSALVFDDFTIRKVKVGTDDGWPGVCKELIFNSGFEDSDIDFTDGDIFQTNRDYALNLFVDPSNTVETRQIITDVCDSVAGWLYTLPDGKFALDRIKPATNTPLLTIDDEEIEGDIVRSFDRAPGLTTRLFVDRNWHPHSDGSILGSVSVPEQQRLIQDYLLTIECSDVEVLGPEYRHAVHAEPRRTLLRDYNGIPLLEINEQVGLYASNRNFYNVTGVLDPAAFTLIPGDTVRLKSRHYGLNHGTDLIVVENNQRRGEEKTDLVLWGRGGSYRIDSFMDFPGTDDYFISTTVAGSDSKLFSCCFVIEPDTFVTVGRFFARGGSTLAISVTTANLIQFFARNVGGTIILNVRTTTAMVAGERYAVCFSVDLADEAQCVINNRIDDLTITTFTDDVMDLGGGNWAIGATSSGANDYDGRIAHLGFLIGTKLDFHDPAVYARFFDIHNRPVFSGTINDDGVITDDGSVAFGAVPEFWFPDSDGENNRGSEIDLPKVGTPAPHTTSPTDDSALKNWIRYQPAARGVFAVANHYKGTNTAPADGDVVSWCVSLYFTSVGGANSHILDWASRGGQIRFLPATDLVKFVIENTSGVAVGVIDTSALVINTQYAILASMNATTGESHLYVNNVEDKTVITTPTGGVIDWRNSQTVGIDAGIVAPFTQGYISHLGCARVFLDFSIPAVRRRFFDKYNRPVHGGFAGRIAFGTDADIWCRGGNGARNEGLAGSLAEVGTVPLATKYPADA